jgi:hypothetical protein
MFHYRNCSNTLKYRTLQALEAPEPLDCNGQVDSEQLKASGYLPECIYFYLSQYGIVSKVNTTLSLSFESVLSVSNRSQHLSGMYMVNTTVSLSTKFEI